MTVATGAVATLPAIVLQSDDLEVGAIAFVLGVVLVVWGFKKYRTGERIRNTPTEKVRSVAAGRTELEGTAEPRDLTFDAPFSEGVCVYASYEIEEYREHPHDDDRDDEWVTVSAGSLVSPFYLDDGTGRVVVDPEDGATFDVSSENSTSHKVHSGSSPPDVVQEFLGGEGGDGGGVGGAISGAVRSLTEDLNQRARGEAGGDGGADETEVAADATDAEADSTGGDADPTDDGDDAPATVEDDAPTAGAADADGEVPADGGGVRAAGEEGLGERHVTRNELGPGSTIGASVGSGGSDDGGLVGKVRDAVDVSVGGTSGLSIGTGGGSGSGSPSNDRRFSQEVLPVGSDTYVYGGAEPWDGDGIANEERLAIRSEDATDQFIVSDYGVTTLASRYRKWGGLAVVGGVLALTVGFYLLLRAGGVA